MTKDLSVQEMLYAFMETNRKDYGGDSYNAGYLSGMLLQLAREDDRVAGMIRRQLNPTLEIVRNG